MQPEAPALIWDARRAAGRVLEFVAGRSWDDYQQDVMLRSAVERQFQIIGEALNRLSKVDPGTAGRVPDLARIVAFRNVLVHGYAQIDAVGLGSRLHPGPGTDSCAGRASGWHGSGVL